MELTNEQIIILEKGLDQEYFAVGPEDYTNCEFLHKEGLIELGFVVPGFRHYWLTSKGRVELGGKV
jgi:hypothetical protein